MKTYIVRSGELRRVTYVDNKGKKIDDYYSAIRDDEILIFRCPSAVQKLQQPSIRLWSYTFKLNVNKLELRLEDTRNLLSESLAELGCWRSRLPEKPKRKPL